MSILTRFLLRALTGLLASITALSCLTLGSVLFVLHNTALTTHLAETAAYVLLQRPVDIAQVNLTTRIAALNLRAQQVRLHNAAGAETTALLEVDDLQASIGLASLWRDGPLQIDNLTIDGLRMHIDGQPTTPMGHDTSNCGENLTWPAILREVRATHLQIQYVDQDQNNRLDVFEITLDQPERGAPLNARLRGEFNALPLTANLELKHSGVASGDIPDQIALRAQWGEAHLKLAGTLPLTSVASTARLEFNLNAQNSEPLLGALGVPEVLPKALTMAGFVTGEPDNIRWSTALEFGDLRGEIDAESSDLTLSSAAFNASLSGPSLFEAGALIDILGLPESSFSITTALRKTGTFLEIMPTAFTLPQGGVTLTGSLPKFPTIDDWLIQVQGQELDAQIFAPFLPAFWLLQGQVDINASATADTRGTESITLSLEDDHSRLTISGVVGNLPQFSHTNLHADYQRQDKTPHSATTPDWAKEAQASAKLTIGALGIPSLSVQVTGHQGFNINGVLNVSKAINDLNQNTPVQVQLSGEIVNLLTLPMLKPNNTPSVSMPLSFTSSLTGSLAQRSGFTLEFDSLGLTGKLKGQLDLTDPLNSTTFNAAIKNKSAQTNALSGLLPPLWADLVNTLPLSLVTDVTLGDGDLFLQAFDLSLGDSELNGHGHLSLPDPTVQSAISFGLRAPDPIQTTRQSAPGAWQEAPLEIAGVITVLGGKASVKQLMGSFGPVRINADAQLNLDNLSNDARVNLQMSGPSSDQLFAMTGINPLFNDVTYRLSVDIADQVAQSGSVSLTLGRSDLFGSIAVTTMDGPKINMRLGSNQVDLHQLFADTPPLGTDASSSATVTTGAQNKKIADYFSSTPWDLSWLNQYEAALQYAAPEIIVNQAQDRAALSLDAQLEAGRLTTQSLTWTDQWVDIGAQVTLATNDSTPQLSVEINGTKRPNWALFGGQQDNLVSAFSGAFSASGNSAAGMLSDAQGWILALGEGGVVDNQRLALVGGDILSELFQRINPFTNTLTSTALECHIGIATLGAGQVNFVPGIALRSQRLDLTVRGTLNLLDETLSLSVRTRPRSGIGLSAGNALTPFVRVGGTLTRPRLVVDVRGSTVAGAAAVASGGLSILAGGLLDRFASSRRDPCTQLMSAASPTNQARLRLLQNRQQARLD